MAVNQKESQRGLRGRRDGTGQRSKNDTQSVTTFVEMVNCVLCVWASLMGNFLSFPAYFLSYHYKSHYTSLLAIIIIIIIIH